MRRQKEDILLIRNLLAGKLSNCFSMGMNRGIHMLDIYASSAFQILKLNPQELWCLEAGHLGDDKVINMRFS